VQPDGDGPSLFGRSRKALLLEGFQAFTEKAVGFFSLDRRVLPGPSERLARRRERIQISAAGFALTDVAGQFPAPLFVEFFVDEGRKVGEQFAAVSVLVHAEHLRLLLYQQALPCQELSPRGT
jgi:hypothetical protein